MKKFMLIIMLMLVTMMLTCSNSIAASTVEKVKIENTKVITLPDGTTQVIPAQYVKCVYPKGGITAGSCNWLGYERTYYAADSTSEPDDEDESKNPARNKVPW